MKKHAQIIAFSCISTLAIAQTHINKEWEANTGNPIGLEWSSSIVNSNSQLISVGNTTTNHQGTNVLTTKYNIDGTIAWQK
jgi:hypothetical protein